VAQGGNIMAISAEIGMKLEEYLSKLVATGRYNSKSEVIREGLRLVQDRESRLAVLDATIAKGLADIKAGRVIGAEEAFSGLEAKFRKAAKS
jgi:antitoxin ParD1/3/4